MAIGRAMGERCRREDFHQPPPLLLHGEAPQFQGYLRRTTEQERGAPLPH
jgi:hypothetical protein